MLRSGWYRIAGYDSSQCGGTTIRCRAALRAPRERYHMLQLVGWAGIKPALLLFLSAFANVGRCLFPWFPPSAFPEGVSLRIQVLFRRKASSDMIVPKRGIAQVIR